MKERKTHSVRPPGPLASGVSLLDVLIALLVLSVGLLGIAALQIMSKSSNSEALQRTTATMLAQSMIERMRANPGGGAAYCAAAAAGWPFPNPGTVCRVPSCTGSACNVCTPDQMAAWDLYEWGQAMEGVAEKRGSADTGGLVSPEVCIACPAGGSGPGQYSVAVVWRGQTPLTNALTTVDCGTASHNYDAPGAPNAYRRVLLLTTYLGS
jgi:type IV pilus assembly protein PilV